METRIERPTQDRVEAAQRVAREHGIALRRALHRHAGGKENAEDALQFAMQKLIECGPTEKEAVVRWVFVVAQREAWKLARRELRECSLDRTVSTDDGPACFLENVETTDATPQEWAESAEYVRDRRHAIAFCKVAEREVLFLIGLGHSYSEIGAAKGWSYTKINRLSVEGRRRARMEFQPEGMLS